MNSFKVQTADKFELFTLISVARQCGVTGLINQGTVDEAVQRYSPTGNYPIIGFDATTYGGRKTYDASGLHEKDKPNTQTLPTFDAIKLIVDKFNGVVPSTTVQLDLSTVATVTAEKITLTSPGTQIIIPSSAIVTLSNALKSLAL